MYGRVIGESPLTVRVEDRLVLKEKQLAFLEGSGVLAEGDMVTLLRVQGGQQFVVLGRVGEPMGIRFDRQVVAATTLRAEPNMNSVVLASLPAGARVALISDTPWHMRRCPEARPCLLFQVRPK